VDGHVNFTVLDHTGSGVGDSFGTGLAGFDATFSKGFLSGGLDTSARYLYLFETVNDGTNPLAISSNTVASSGVTSWGTFSGVGFTNSGTPTAPGGPYLGGAGGASTTRGNSSGTGVTGGVPGAAFLPGYGPQIVLNQTSSVQAEFLGGGLPAGSISYVWGYTSNLVPTFGPTNIQDGGTGAGGTVPTATPEPCSLVLFLGVGSTFAGFGGARMWRRKQNNFAVA